QITVEKNNTHRGNMFTGSGVFTDTGMDLTLWYIVHRLVKCCCPRGKCSCAASEDSARDSVHVLVWIVQSSCACVCVDSAKIMLWSLITPSPLFPPLFFTLLFLLLSLSPLLTSLFLSCLLLSLFTSPSPPFLPLLSSHSLSPLPPLPSPLSLHPFLLLTPRGTGVCVCVCVCVCV